MFNTGADLFTSGDFISHAGLPLKWKIECDAIRPEEWDCLAQMIMDYQKMPFSWVEGIPRGGMSLASALEKYIDPYTSMWQKRYYETLFNNEDNHYFKKQVCLNYMEGLEWVMNYYTTGCIDWRWTYKYNYPPLLCARFMVCCIQTQ